MDKKYTIEDLKQAFDAGDDFADAVCGSCASFKNEDAYGIGFCDLSKRIGYCENYCQSYTPNDGER